jgi:hypothetical protein
MEVILGVILLVSIGVLVYLALRGPVVFHTSSDTSRRSTIENGQKSKRGTAEESIAHAPEPDSEENEVTVEYESDIP